MKINTEELKTLNDFKIPWKELNVISPLCGRAVEKALEDIKKEAINHIKAPGELVEPSETRTIAWIKYFFNITEEDLK